MVIFSAEANVLIGDRGLQIPQPTHSQLLCSLEAMFTWDACQRQYLHYVRKNGEILPAWEARSNPRSLSTDFSESELTKYIRLSREIPNLVLRTHQRYPITPPQKQLLKFFQESYWIKSQWLEVLLLDNSALDRKLRATQKRHYKFDAELSAAIYGLVEAVYERKTWAKAFDSPAQLWLHWLSEECEIDLAQKGLLTVKGIGGQTGKVKFAEENRKILNSLQEPHNLRIVIEGDEPVATVTSGAATIAAVLSIAQREWTFASKASGPYQKYLRAERQRTNFLRNEKKIRIPYLDSQGALHFTAKFRHIRNK